MGTCSSYSFKLKYQDKELFYHFSQCKRGSKELQKRLDNLNLFFLLNKNSSTF